MQNLNGIFVKVKLGTSKQRNLKNQLKVETCWTTIAQVLNNWIRIEMVRRYGAFRFSRGPCVTRHTFRNIPVFSSSVSSSPWHSTRVDALIFHCVFLLTRWWPARTQQRRHSEATWNQQGACFCRQKYPWWNTKIDRWSTKPIANISNLATHSLKSRICAERAPINVSLRSRWLNGVRFMTVLPCQAARAPRLEQCCFSSCAVANCAPTSTYLLLSPQLSPSRPAPSLPYTASQHPSIHSLHVSRMMGINSVKSALTWRPEDLFSSSIRFPTFKTLSTLLCLICRRAPQVRDWSKLHPLLISPSLADVGPANLKAVRGGRRKGKYEDRSWRIHSLRLIQRCAGCEHNGDAERRTICARAEALPKPRPQTNNEKDERDTRHKTHDTMTVQKEQLRHCEGRTTTRRAADAG